MRGLENLLRMRKRGLKPSVVWVETQPMAKWTRPLTESIRDQVDIHLTPRDVLFIQTADLRALVGLHVMVNGLVSTDTEKLARACFNAGAGVVEAFFFDYSRKEADRIVKAMRFSADGEKTVWPK